MNAGVLDLTLNELVIISIDEEGASEVLRKDTSFMAPEVPAAVFKEEGVENVTVAALIPTKDLTSFLVWYGTRPK